MIREITYVSSEHFIEKLANFSWIIESFTGEMISTFGGLFKVVLLYDRVRNKERMNPVRMIFNFTIKQFFMIFKNYQK